MSLSPGITELVYALHLENRLVGVTRFCDYPKAAQSKAKIGGFTDPNMEAILRLHPDLVVLQTDQADWQDSLEAMGTSTLTVDLHRVQGIRQGAEALAQVCQVSQAGQQLLAQLDQAETQMRQLNRSGESKPRVMVVIGAAMGSTSLEDVYIASSASIYPELIRLAGGSPAYEGPPGLAFAQVSREGLLRLNPDVIVELVPTDHPSPQIAQQRLSLWRKMTMLKAVKTHQVYVLTDEVMVRPGPRYTEIAQTLARILQSTHHE